MKIAGTDLSRALQLSNISYLTKHHCTGLTPVHQHAGCPPAVTVSSFLGDYEQTGNEPWTNVFKLPVRRTSGERNLRHPLVRKLDLQFLTTAFQFPISVLLFWDFLFHMGGS